MVNLNLTFFIELGLFLLFLWGTSRFILRPALKVIDEREDRIQRDQDAAQARGRDADAMEAEYQRILSAARADAQRHFFETQSRAIEAGTARLNAARRALEDAVAETRAAGEAELSEQRRQLALAAPDVAEELMRRLELGSPGR